MTNATQPIDMFPTSGLENSPHLFARQNDAPDDWEAAVDADRAPHGQAEETEKNIVLGAFERARSLVSEKAQALSQNSKRIGAVATASIALTVGYPAAQSIVDKAPQAHAAEVDYGTGGYPWANDTPLEIGPNGFPIRDCTGWVAWKLESTGRDPNRLTNSDVTGEIIDNNPAADAVANTPDGSHSYYVEEVTDTHITLSDYNGIGGPYKYGIKTYERTNPGIQNLKYVHVELPAPQKVSEETENPTTKNPNLYLNAEYDKRNKNAITTKRPVLEGSYLKSKNGGRYRLVVNKGAVKLYDSKENDEVKWSTKTNKQAMQLQIKTGKGKQRGKNTLTFGNSKRDYKKWNIGPATKVEVGKDGTLAGYKGSKRVWVAEELAAVSRAAKQSMSKIASVRQKALGR